MYKFEFLELLGSQVRVEFENSSGLFHSRFVNIPKSAVYDPANLNSLREDKSFMDIMQGIQQGLMHKENIGLTEFIVKDTPQPPPVMD